MVTAQTLLPSDLDAFRTFVGGMLNEWIDHSSLQRDVTCCPDRTVAAVLEQYERAAHSDGGLVIAKDDHTGAVVGTLVLEYGPRWLRTAVGVLLNVHPNYRRSGCARRLLGVASCELHRRRMKKLRLATWEGNDTVVNLFTSCGAQVTDRDPGHTVTTDNFLPLVLSTIDDEGVDARVRSGAFRACSSTDGEIVDFELQVDGAAHRLCVVAS
jgi:GNAT superfamily N-acetyltransferase